MKKNGTAFPKDPSHNALQDENSNDREENNNHAENPEESFEENVRNIYDTDYDEEEELNIIHLLHHQCYTDISNFYAEKEEGKTHTKKWTRGNGEMIHSWLTSMGKMFNNTIEKPNNRSTGLYLKFRSSSSEKPTLYEVGHIGRRVMWRQHGTNECDGWLYGRWKITDDNEKSLEDKLQEWEFSGGTEYDNPDNVEYLLAYIYQDMKTAIVGEFSNGVLLGGFHRKIVGHKCKEGIMILRFSKLGHHHKDKPPYRFESPTSSFITSSPKLMDPYEKSNIYINQSTIPGMQFSDGIFAKRKIPKDRLVAVYAGLLLDNLEYQSIFKNVTFDTYADVHKNVIELNDSFTMDVPPNYSNIIDYRSSLAHKVNFKWKESEINGEFADMNHPRFGSVICIRSTRDIEIGEEIYVDYGYGEDEEDWHPKWYKDILREQKDENNN